MQTWTLRGSRKAFPVQGKKDLDKVIQAASEESEQNGGEAQARKEFLRITATGIGSANPRNN